MTMEKSGARNAHGVRRKTDTLKMKNFTMTKISVPSEKGEPMREKLIELLTDAMPSCYSDTFASQIADYLIANGVTVPVGEIEPDYEAEDV